MQGAKLWKVAIIRTSSISLSFLGFGENFGNNASETRGVLFDATLDEDNGGKSQIFEPWAIPPLFPDEFSQYSHLKNLPPCLFKDIF